METWNNRKPATVAALLVLALAVPALAAIPLDPGAAPMVWHVVGGSVVLAAFKWRRILELLNLNSALRTPRSRGFAFATAWALVAIPLALQIFDGRPIPRFNDIFLIGIVLTAYFFTWEAAAFLLGVSVLASAWILPPYGSILVNGFSEWYRLISFTAVSAFLIFLLSRIKSRRPDASHAAGD